MQSTSQKAITIAGVNVSQDDHGRFNLNDLHTASGGDRKNQPSNWTRTETASSLASEIDQSSDSRTAAWHRKVGGKNPGTYVCKELVYAYAMWISPAFHLKVIRAYDALVTQQIEHAASRQTARLEAPALTDAVKYQRETDGKPAKHYHFSNEFDLVNRIALGMTAKKYREEHGIAPGEPIRDHVTALEIKCVEHLQRVNASLIDIGMPFQDRKARLSQIYSQRHAAALENTGNPVVSGGGEA